MAVLIALSAPAHTTAAAALQVVSRSAADQPAAAASGVTVFALPVTAPITDAGRVLFLSTAPLSPDLDINAVIDVYAWSALRTHPFSLGGRAPLASVYGNARSISVSGDGLHAVECRPRDDLLGPVRAFVWHLADLHVEELALPAAVGVDAAACAAEGRIVAFTSSAHAAEPVPGNDLAGVFRLDRVTGALTLISATAAGRAANAASALAGCDDSGSRILFLSAATDLPVSAANGQTQAYLWRDVDGSPTLARLSQRPDGTAVSRVLAACLSLEGHVAAFTSDDPGLLAGGPAGVVGVYAVGVDSTAIERISVSADGTAAEMDSAHPALSRDGRFVVFTSAADNLAGTATHGAAQIFLRDRLEGTTVCLSQAPAGAVADADCTAPAISPSGRFITFVSAAANLVAEGLPAGVPQVYLLDRGAAFANRQPQAQADHLTAARGASVTTRLTATDPDGDATHVFITALPAAGVLYDGPAALAAAVITPVALPYRLTDPEARITLLPPAAEFAGSLDLRFAARDEVALSAPATVVVTYGDTDAGIITRLSASAAGSEPDGSAAPDGTPCRVGITAAGDRIVFASLATNLSASDANQALDVFLWDRHASALTRVSEPDQGTAVTSGLPSDDGAISAEGRFVAFSSAARLAAADTNTYTDIYLQDLATGGIALVSMARGGQSADGNSSSPDLSASADYVVFSSAAHNLVDTDTGAVQQIYLWERATGALVLVSRDADGLAANAPCRNPRLSADGGAIVFDSDAGNLAGPSNGWRQVFVYWRVTDVLARLSQGATEGPVAGHAQRPAISHAGRFVAFEADAADLVPDDHNGRRDIFLHDQSTGQTSRISQSGSAIEADQDCFNAAISGNGRCIGFRSRSNSLTAAPAAGLMSAFVVDRRLAQDDAARLRRLAHGVEPSTPANGDSWNVALSVDGRFAAFASDATNLVSADLNGVRDVFLSDFGEPPNRPPTAADISVETAMDSAVTITMRGADADGDDLWATILAAPAHGQLGLVDGSCTPDHPLPTVVYTPAPGYVGDDQIRFAISDGVATAAAVVVIAISVPNRPPQLTLSQPRLAAPTGAAQCVIPWELFHVVDPDQPGAPAPSDLALLLLAAPSSGRLSDVGRAPVQAGARIAPAAFPLLYEPSDPSAFAAETLCFRALADAWESGTVCLEVVVGGVRQDLRLETGWNLVSFRMDPLDRQPETLFGQGDHAAATSVWSWEAQTRTYHRAGILVGGRGYWVYLGGPSVTLSALVGRPSAITTRLAPGWSLVGPVGPGDTPRLPVGRDQGATVLWGWDAIGQQYRRVLGLDAGLGCWVHVLSATELSLSLE